MRKGERNEEVPAEDTEEENTAPETGDWVRQLANDN